MAGPQTYNEARCDEVAREAFCKAAQHAMKYIEEDGKDGKYIPALDEKLSGLAAIMESATSAFVSKDESEYD